MRGRLKRGAWILAFLVALPIAGLFAGRAARWRAEVTFREQMERVVPTSERARTQTRPLAELCAVPGAETDVACDAYAPAVLLVPLSIVVAAAGLLALGLIVGAGAAARADLALLVTLFRPGLWAIAACTIGLIAGHALVVVTVIAALGGVGPSLGGAAVVLVIGALAGCWAVARSLFGIFGPARIEVLGAVLTPAEAPALWQLVDELGARLGALRPDRIVAGLGVMFFVTESEVATPHEVVTGRTLCLSLPLARIFTVDELRAIIGHELGHFRGEDTAYSRQFVPIYRGATGALARLSSVRGGARTLALLPAFAIIGMFLDAFDRAEKHHGRARELLADAAGAEATSARALASALVKTHAFAPFWGSVAMSAQVDALNLRQGNAGPPGWRERYNLSRLFEDLVRSAATAERLRDIGQSRTSHPTDTHPPLAARLAALGLDVAAIEDDALRVVPPVAASTLLADATALEAQLSATYLQWLGGPAGQGIRG